MADWLSNGRRSRILSIVDDFSIELVGQLIGFSISGYQVVLYLAQLAVKRGLPRQITMINGSESICKAMDFWSGNTSLTLGFIKLGKRTPNAFAESFNGKVRNECPNQHWLRPLDEAKSNVDQWHDLYNQVEPHSSLGYVPSVEVAKRAA